MTSSPQVGVHLAHVNQGSTPAMTNAFTCTACHGTGANTYSSTHTNSTVEVAFTGIASATGATYSFGGSTCSATYCHGNFEGGRNATTPAWNAAGKLACTACHLAPPVPAAAAGSTPVSYHPNNANGQACHGGPVPNG